MKYLIEVLLRIIAKNQLADGAFCNKKEGNLQQKIESTAVSVLAFTLGKEDVKIYMNQINKALRYVIKTTKENENLLDERLIYIVVLALKSSIEKRLVRQPSRTMIEDYIEILKDKIKENKYMHIEDILTMGKNSELKNATSSMISLNKEEKINEESLITSKGTQKILDIAKLAIQKTL